MNEQHDEQEPQPPEAPQRLRRTLRHNDPRATLLNSAWREIDSNPRYRELSRQLQRQFDNVIYTHVLDNPTPQGLNRFINDELTRIINARLENRDHRESFEP